MSRSEMVGALGLALGQNAPSKWGGKPPTATCPTAGCGEPLVSELRFPGAEFLCVCCGARVGYVQPVPVEDTPEVAARLAELTAAHDETRGMDAGELAAWLADRLEARTRGGADG